MNAKSLNLNPTASIRSRPRLAAVPSRPANPPELPQFVPPVSLASRVQSFCAQAALFLLPLPALKHPSISLTAADLFLVPAVLLSLGHGLRLHAFQLPFLMALPLNLLSHMLDPDGTLTPILQVLYIWGLLIPFGWCAFVNLTPQRIALLLLLPNGLSSLVAIGQFADLLPILPTQKIIEFSATSGRRAPGLVLQCNSLAMVLTPCFLLMPYVRRASLRIVLLLLLLGGLASTVSKSAVLAIPGLLFYFFWSEPQKAKVLTWLTVAAALSMVVLPRGANVRDVAERMRDTILYRTSYTDNSVDDRAHLANVALDHVSESLLLGFGTDGTYRLMNSRGSMGQTVHVLYLGLWLTVGGVALVLTVIGFVTLCLSLWRARQTNFAIFLASYLSAIGVTTMLYLSYQYAPFLVAAAVIAREKWFRESSIRSAQSTRLARAARPVAFSRINRVQNRLDPVR